MPPFQLLAQQHPQQLRSSGFVDLRQEIFDSRGNATQQHPLELNTQSSDTLVNGY
jgi:hypothetical protein